MVCEWDPCVVFGDEGSCCWEEVDLEFLQGRMWPKMRTILFFLFFPFNSKQ